MALEMISSNYAQEIALRSDEMYKEAGRPSRYVAVFDSSTFRLNFNAKWRELPR